MSPQPRTPFIRVETHQVARRGFALIVTIVLVAFLVLILVGLATFTRVETQVATNSQDLAKARQNALFALNLAVGKLQQAAGPDQRVTATAEIMAPTDASKRKWTGVWDTTNPAAGPTWLVSGATPAANTAAPTLPAGINHSATEVRLVGDATTDTATAGNGIILPLEEIRTNGIPGLADIAGGHPIGRYAFWVGDEGVKARVNFADELGAKSAPDASDLWNRASVTQRSAVEWVETGAGATSFGDLIPAAGLLDLDRVMERSQIAFTAASPADAPLLLTADHVRFHDIGYHSAGVQADVRLGGLKRDLSAAFEMNDADFQASIFANAAPASQRAPMALSLGNSVDFVFSEDVGAGQLYRGPTWHLLRSHYRIYRDITNPTGTPRVDARRLAPAVGTGGTNTILDLYNGNSVNADPKVSDTITKDGNTQTTPRPTQSALLPYINRITLVASLQTVATGAVNPEGIEIYDVRIVLTPYLVLHNPYSVRLNLRDFNGDGRWGCVLFRGIHFDQLVRTKRDGNNDYDFTARGGSNDRDRAIPLLLAGVSAGTDGYNAFMRLYVPPLTLEPGEVRVFSGNLSTPAPIGSALELEANAYFESGYYFDQLNASGDMFGTYTKVRLPIGPGGALEGATSADVPAHNLIKVLANRPLSLALFTATKTGDNNNAIFRFHAKTRSGDVLEDAETLVAEPYMEALNPSDSAQSTYAAYGSFEGFQGGDLASTYAGTPTPMFAWDFYVKPADQGLANAARPFVTSNPAAVVTQRSSMGDWTKRGFPLVQMPWQVTYRQLSPNAWSEKSVLDVDAGGNGRAYWGSSNSDAGLQQVSVRGLPVRPMLSLAEFQNLDISLYGHEPARAIGNAIATPFNDPTSALINVGKAGVPSWWQADITYLANRGLWDSTFFSSLSPAFDASAGSYYTGASASDALSRETLRDAWLTGARSLPNTRVVPYFSPNRTLALRQSQMLDPRTAAANLLVEGSFNVNSRSIEAWTAVLAGARGAGLPRIGGTTESVGPELGLPRSLPVAAAERGAGDNEKWSGFAQLDNDDIRALATQIVAQVTARQQQDGRPFLSLAEFVNRRIAAPADATLNSVGAIQAAIDATDLNDSIAGTDVDSGTQTDFPFPTQGRGSAASAASGWISQADVLQQIGPFLSARSDTFLVRTYGEAYNSVTDTTSARAWCEAVVQRVPDFIDAADSPETALSALTSTDNATFGRRFKIVSFRWIGPEDL